MEIVSFIPATLRKKTMLAAQEDRKPFLVLGASGTGKSALARWLHKNSPRSLQSFKTLHHGAKVKLAQELMDANNNLGEAVRKRDVMQKNADANKAFAHFRW